MESLITLAVIFFLIGPILAVIALVQTSSLHRTIDELKRKVEALSQLPQATAPAASLPIVTAAEQAETFETWQVLEPTINMALAEVEEAPPFQPHISPDPSPDPLPDPSPEFMPPARNIEQALASRWLVWLGGIAIALGGILLIKYAADNGWVPPLVRVIIGLASGAGLAIAGEWVRIKRGGAVKDYVPAALSAAGLVIAFGVSYAAYALYDIFSPAVVFPFLAAISLCALWLATRQGQLIAGLGLIGATFTPALVGSNDPNSFGFFAYLLVILIASLWLLRRLNWWWLGYAAVIIAAGWALIWMTGVSLNPTLPIGLFGLTIGVAATLMPRGREILATHMGNLSNASTISPPMGVAIAGMAAGSGVLATLVIQSGHGALPLAMFAVAMAGIVAFGWFRQGLVAAPLLAAGVTFLVLMAWRDAGSHAWAFAGQGLGTIVPGQVEPSRFRNTMLVALVAFTMMGARGILTKQDQRPWATLAAGSACVFLLGAWGRADFTLPPMGWAALAIALTLALGFAAKQMIPKLDEAHAAKSFEVLIIGMTLLSLFAFDRLLDGVWLTLAIAALATALAYLARKVSLANVAGIASIIASFAAVRLFLGHGIWGEPQGLPLGGYCVLYGYGVPALLFWQASKWLAYETFTRWRVAFEGLSLGLAVSMVSLTLRVLIDGGMAGDEMGLLGLGAQACAGLGAAYGLAYRQQLYSSLVSKWGARILLTASIFALIVILTLQNPVISGERVVGGQVFNALWLAYLAPVPLLAIIARKLDGLGWAQLRSGLGVLALLLVMGFITLWVKRQFQDATLDVAFLSQGESYTISLAWLLSGIGLFVAGLKFDRQSVRYGGLAIIVLTVLKVFGYDLFSLGGLWRIASIIGLGLCLVGVGWLYTRFMVGKSAPVDV